MDNEPYVMKYIKSRQISDELRALSAQGQQAYDLFLVSQDFSFSLTP